MLTLPAVRIAWWKLAVALAITAGGLAFAFRKVDLIQLTPLLQNARWHWMLAAVGAFGFACLASSARWHLALRVSGQALHPAATIRCFLVGHFWTVALSGGAGGDLARSGCYSRWFRLPFPEVTASAPIERLLGFLGATFVGFAAVGISAARGKLPAPDTLQLRMPGAGVFVAVLAVAAILGGVVLWMARKRGPQSRLRRFLDTLREGARTLAARPHLALRGFVWGVLTQVSLACVTAACLEAVGARGFVWLDMFWTLSVISLLTLVPSVAGLGVRENASLAVLGLYGLPPEQLVSASLLCVVPQFFWAGAGALALWREERAFQRAGAGTQGVPGTISVVIPALNEADQLPETIARVRRVPEVVEIIVADGGSRDGTAEIASRLGCRLVQSAPGRGRQLRAGAVAASGDVVLLLHADTWLEPGAGRAVLNCFRDPMVTGGGCWKVFRDGTWLMRGSRLRCALRLFLFRRVMGDQAMFVRRDILERLGGVPDVPLMEEFALSRRMRRFGALALAESTVSTSARRFRERGVLRTYARMWRVTILHHLGASPEKLCKIYERK